jgi:CheY-like chemotaxis protein
MTEMAEKVRADLTGWRVLIVEDQMIIAMEIEDVLLELGCVVVGPIGTVDAALALARKEALDAAILDVSLDDEKVFPVAEMLQARGIPFIFSTGYGEAALPEKWRTPLRLSKPFQRDQIETLMRGMAGL